MPPIVALQGASSAVIQSLLAGFARDAAARGLRVAGVVELAEPCGPQACGGYALRDLSTGRQIAISQDLGPGSVACNLDPGGLADACAAVERAIAEGVDLVVLSKFGKQEAARAGLMSAFCAAFAVGAPIATAVAPAMAVEWSAFAGECFEFAIAAPGALEAWWSRRRRAILPAAAEQAGSADCRRSRKSTSSCISPTAEG